MMFGPQARAAELQAVRSAALRQRSHEAGEQIPIHTPVSLTDFARGQTSTKNKGIKQFKPLALEDLDDRSNDVEIETKPLPNEAIDRYRSRLLVCEATAHQETERTIPTGPKAMVCPTSIAARIRASDTEDCPHHVSDKTSKNTSDPCGWTPETARTINQHAIHSVASQSQTSHQWNLQLGDFAYGLDGYSPAKPELQVEHFRGSQLQPSMYRTLQHDHPQPNQLPLVSAQQYSDLFTVYPRPDTKNSNSFRCTNMPFYSRNSFMGHPRYVHPRLERTNSFVDDVMRHENNLQEQDVASIALEFERSYDRSTKMQSFVAAQQAMAKTGKTVLHNPKSSGLENPVRVIEDQSTPAATLAHPCSVHQAKPAATSKSPAESPSVDNESAPSDNLMSSGFTPRFRALVLANCIPHNSIQALESVQRRKLDECPAIKRAVQQRNVIEHPKLYMTNSSRVDKPVRGYQRGDVDFQHSNIPFPIGLHTENGSWFVLRALTRADRDKLKEVFQAVEAEITNHADNYKVSYCSAVTGDKAHEWFQTYATWPSMRTLCVNGTVCDSEVQLRGTTDVVTIGHLTSEDRKSFDSLTVGGIADVMATLQHYKETKPDADMFSFMHTPTSTTHKSSANQTLNPINTGCIASPPARLARDPRYQPISAQYATPGFSLQLW